MSDMYEWVTAENKNPLIGACPHRCRYCYVQKLMKRSKVLTARYTGELRLDAKLLKTKVKGGVRFLCSCNDLFAEEVPDEMISVILAWAVDQNTTWIFQSKNPKRMLAFKRAVELAADCNGGAKFIWGTTIETNRAIPFLSDAPPPCQRAVRGLDFITVEPALKFDLFEFLALIKMAKPKFINIGADSGKNDLIEPTRKELLELIAGIKEVGIEIRKKSNLERLLKRNIKEVK